ncbi:2-oxoisovalerate dehydrogenase subunit alpha mitochondrial precursor [Lepidopterella palustris CBS 459.81]|uniref:2-oxoisovalerate dehydrogenase subunit alpha n=1 Tax=Lepidopterella palustris CBS 459.81 TaxID=1314670 RepID=A0A8E2E531_9PEZI|nr:2-oxoisovalerate dehydrogenase subunit alpha mitochondrial precursor [Lepidopterella palustris CBS 459.81]
MSLRYGARSIRPRRNLYAPACFNPSQAPSIARSWQRWSSVAESPASERVLFPGALKSKFTNDLAFIRPAELEAIPTYRVMNQDGVVIDETRDLGTTDEEALTLYRKMICLSVMDLIMFEAQRQGRLSFYMVSTGEEGITIGSSSALDPSDVVFAQYREAGVLMERGFTLDQFMNQFFSNCKDFGKGRNMPVHFGSRELNVHTISSTLATQIPHSSGAAYALKMQAKLNPDLPGRIACCYFGEGAASEGDFHGALNIAATRACPVIFLCRNNGFAISTPTSDQYRGDGVASRGAGYGIDTIRVDGNDIFAVRQAIKEARREALADGGKPILVEAMAYRIGHHSTSDDSFAYRQKVEVEDWKRRDNPITRLRKWLEGRGLWDEAKEKELRSKVRKEILVAFDKAEKEKKPALKHAFSDVWENFTEEQKSQMEELRSVLERYPEEYDIEQYEGGLDSLKEDLKQ